MEWLRDLLKGLGVEDAKLDAAVAEFKKELPYHFVPKAKYNKAAAARKKARQDRADREMLRRQIEAMHEFDLMRLRLTEAAKLALDGKSYDADREKNRTAFQEAYRRAIACQSRSQSIVSGRL